MFKNIVLGLIGLSVAGTAAFADGEREVCYQLSRDGNAWSRTAEVLCLEQLEGENREYLITLRTGLRADKLVASFNYVLVSAARCMDACNYNTYGLANPENSLFNELSISFAGKYDRAKKVESGKVWIGKSEFHYRSY